MLVFFALRRNVVFIFSFICVLGLRNVVKAFQNNVKPCA